MTELLQISTMPKDFKILLLRELGYDSDGSFVLNEENKIYLDRYTNDPILIDNMVIFHGSTIILDNNPLSVSSFLEEFGDVV